MPAIKLKRDTYLHFGEKYISSIAMDASSSFCSAGAISVYSRSSHNVTASDKETVTVTNEQIQSASFIIRLMKSRMLFLNALIQDRPQTGRGRKKRKMNTGNDTSVKIMDVTTYSDDFKVKAHKMWSAIENIQIKSIARRGLVFNMVGGEVLKYQQRHLLGMPEPFDGSAIDPYRNAIFAYTGKLFILNNRQKEMLQLREQLASLTIQKRKTHKLFLARLSQKLAERQGDSDLSQRQKDKNDKRKSGIRLARNIINYILAFNQVEAMPELMEIKEKYRPPLSF